MCGGKGDAEKARYWQRELVLRGDERGRGSKRLIVGRHVAGAHLRQGARPFPYYDGGKPRVTEGVKKSIALTTETRRHREKAVSFQFSIALCLCGDVPRASHVMQAAQYFRAPSARPPRPSEQ